MSNFLNTGDSVEINGSTEILDMSRLLDILDTLVTSLDAITTNLNTTYDILNR